MSGGKREYIGLYIGVMVDWILVFCAWFFITEKCFFVGVKMGTARTNPERRKSEG